MYKKIIKNHWQEISFNFLIIFIFIIFYGRFGDINVDSFREAYIPSQILTNNILYKNIFTIYAPLSYLINAVLFLIFGVKLSTLYYAGLLSTLLITNIAYKIANIFLKKQYSYVIILFFIATSVLSPNVFNTFFPYSYGILYGLMFILCSIYYFLKAQYPLSYLFYSMAICSKYEFILMLPLLIFMTRKKDLNKNIIALLLPPTICLSILLLSKVSVQDILITSQLLIKMSTTKTLTYFYSVMGYIFHLKHLTLYLIKIVQLAIPIAILYFAKQRWIKILSCSFLLFTFNQASFIYIFPLIVVLYLVKFKTFSKNEHFFICASILISLKIFFAYTLQAYGIFFTLFAIISIYILSTKNFRKILFYITIIATLSYGYQNTKILLAKNYEINTHKGLIKTNPYFGKSYKNMITFIENNTSNEDMVIVYPEGLALNFLADRISDNKFYSLIPLYVETFNENNINKRLELIQPSYIIITNYDTSNYYFKQFGKDYAINVMNYINRQYTQVYNYNKNMEFVIYKIK